MSGDAPGTTHAGLRDDADAPMPLRTKVTAGIVAVVAVLASGYGLLRMSSPAIPPGQTPPAGHYPLSCTLCHTVSADAVIGAAR